MKTDEIMVLGAAALFAWYLLKGGVSVEKFFGKSRDYVNSILNPALPGQPGYGWAYYENGTAIGPDGAYYLNGQLVYKNAG